MSDNKSKDSVFDNDDLLDDYTENNSNDNIGGKSKKDSAPKRHITTTVILVVLFLIFLISAASLIKIFSEYQKGINIYESIEAAVFNTEETAMIPEGTTAEKVVYESVSYAEVETPAPLEEVNFSSIKALNSDGIGWIQIPAITRSYPIAQGNDNSFYLDHTFTKEINNAGCIFMDARNYPDFSDKNTIIYGHNMKNGTMFGMLNRFEKEEFYKDSNQFFYITTENGDRAYQIFAVCLVPSTSKAYTLDFTEDNTFEDYLNYLKENSLYSTNVSVLPTDYVVTLSTCTSDSATRRIVVGKYIGTVAK